MTNAENLASPKQQSSSSSSSLSQYRPPSRQHSNRESGRESRDRESRDRESRDRESRDRESSRESNREAAAASREAAAAANREAAAAAATAANREMDLEDLIAPSKVSKSGSHSQTSAPINTMASMHSNEQEASGSASLGSDHNVNDGNKQSDANAASSSGNQQQDSDSGERRGRRTRGKRPRSGEELESLVMPERKRELRSSAGRLAAAAAARHALEAKMASASSHESLNLSTTSSHSDDQKYSGGDNET